MSKIEMVRAFLEAVGMPKKQQADVCCYAILAIAGIKPRTPWKKAANAWIRIHDIIQFINQFYKTTYAENSRETFRKQAMHAFRSAAIIEDNGLATNSPNYRYRLTEETLSVLQCLDNEDWLTQVNLFLTYHEKLVDIYASKKLCKSSLYVLTMLSIFCLRASIMCYRKRLLKALYHVLLHRQSAYI